MCHLSRVALALAFVLPLAACDAQEPPATPEPLFAPGECGGRFNVEGTEPVTQPVFSPDGERVALIRRYTPDSPSDPMFQLWITKADGTAPEFIGPGVLNVIWADDGQRMLVTVGNAVSQFLYELDLPSRTAQLWSGADSLFFVQDKTQWAGYVPGEPRKAYVTVWGQSNYQPPYTRGLYTLDLTTGEVEGPLLDLFEYASVNEAGGFLVGKKWVEEGHPDRATLDGNLARYDPASDTWDYITDVHPDTAAYDIAGRVNPARPLVAYSRLVKHATHLFLVNADGADERQITRGCDGGVRWTADGERLTFMRDVNKGPGIHHVPYVYDLSTDEERVLWPGLPDSVPAFPPVPPPSVVTFGGAGAARE